MPPIVKDTAVPSTVPANSDNRTLLQMPGAYRPSSETAGRVQPVALEVPVSVNGSRTLDGSDTREPFSEKTKTVLVFGNGAVIRLIAPVAAGQLLFLTNEKTRREVVCQVVKSKTYRNVSGYVEIEFTEPSPGFWGVRFPNDRLGSAKETVPAPVVSIASSVLQPPSAPAEQKPESPSAVSQKPLEPPAAAPTAKEFPLDSFPFAPPTVAPRIAAINKPAVPPVTEQAAKSLDELLAEITAISPVSAKPIIQPVHSKEPELNLTALQEQISSLLSSESQTSSPNSFEDASSKILSTPTLSDPVSHPQAPQTAAPETKIENLPEPVSQYLGESDELEMPTWLKTATAQVVNRSTELPAKLESVPRAPALAADSESSSGTEFSAIGSFGTTLTEGISDPGSQARSGNALWIGIAAAALLLSAGGYWYFQQSPPTVSATSSHPSEHSEHKVTPDAPSDVAVSSRTQAAPSTVDIDPVKSEPAVDGSSSTKNPSPSGLAADSAVLPTPPPVSQSKASSLGKLHLAAPVIRKQISSPENVPVPTFEAQNTPSTAPMGAGFGVSGAQPAAPSAPLAIGGNVIPAKLLASVQPAYGALAKSQHVSGDVKIDALIDAHGRVTTMKVLSGPPLLQQAAMDALRQWKYQPATLNGNPVSMHLTVTLQFRLQ